MPPPHCDTPCPTQERLGDFWFGRLPSAALEEVANHLSACRQCSQALDALRPEEDVLVLNIQQSQEAKAVTPPAWYRLEELALELVPHTGSFAAALTTPDSPRTCAPTRSRLGPYILLERLGQGGMGVVYKAHHAHLNRPAAVKMILTGSAAGTEERQRFHTEGAALARLHHPNVVELYEFDEAEDQIYYSMEFVEGGTLAHKLAKGRLTPAEAAELVCQLADGVEAAHARGVVHRDLKPANVLLTATGTPKIADFGLARMLDAVNSLTMSGMVMGTPSYMAPEQTVDAATVSPASDVYSLGAILYEALTGQPPFKEEDRLKTMHAVRTARPRPLTPQLNEPAPALEAICLKCLAKEPEERYQTAAELSDKLRRWLKGETTVERPRLPLFSVGRWAALVGLAVALLVLAWSLVPAAEEATPGVEQLLAAGDTVELIGVKGAPHRKPYWLDGHDKGVHLSQSKDGCFTVRAWGRGMLALLPAVPVKAYVLSAQVRHDDSNAKNGNVGVFVAGVEHPRAQGVAWQSLSLIYSDCHDVREQHLELARRVPNAVGFPPPPKGNSAFLRSSVYGPDGCGDRFSFQGAKRRTAWFAPKPTTWRHLEIEVRPDSVVARWEDQSSEPLPAVAVAKAFHEEILFQQKRKPRFAAWLPPCDGYAPHGSLGLLVSGSAASFRNVTIRPLAGAD